MNFSRPLPFAYPPESGTFTLAWIPKALDSPVSEVGREGCLRAAGVASERFGIAVECLSMEPETPDMTGQARAIDEAIAMGVDAIGINCYDPEGCIEPINRAAAAGIPVMTWDGGSPQSPAFTALGVDHYASGWAAGELLVRLMGESGQVAVLTGAPGTPNLNDRIDGFTDYVARYPGIEITLAAASGDDPSLAARTVEETLQAHPDLDGWFLAGPWPVFAGRGAMPLFEDAVLNRGMKAVAFDTLPVELEWVQAGLLHGLVGQKYWNWGYDTVFMSLNHALNLYPYAAWTDSGMDIVTIHNVDAMAEAWNTLDFSRPLPPAFPE